MVDFRDVNVKYSEKKRVECSKDFRIVMNRRMALDKETRNRRHKRHLKVQKNNFHIRRNSEFFNFNFGAMWVSQEVHGESGESGDFNSPTREAWRKEPPCDSESFRFDATRSSKMWLEKRDQEAWPWLLIDFARCWVINSGSVGKDWNLEIPLVGVFCYSCGWMVYLQSWGRSSMMFNKIFLWEWFLLFMVTSFLCWVRIDIDVINAHP